MKRLLCQVKVKEVGRDSHIEYISLEPGNLNRSMIDTATAESRG